MQSIATIISYCTNDFRFISKCIEEAKIFSSQILIPVCDHFFDGTPENRHLLEHTYAQHPDCQFIEFSYFPDRLYTPYHSLPSDDPDWAIFWAATTRYIGCYYVDPAIDYLFFLDSDEIVEGQLFLEWFREGRVLDAQRLAAYYYALTSTFRAKHVVNLPLLVKRDTFSPLTHFNELERIGAYMSHPGPKREEVVGLNGLPMVHHYSWVRTKEECLWKTRTWSHRNDEDWPTLIEEAFKGQTQRLFGTTHEFENISRGYFDPLAVVLPKDKPPVSPSNVWRIDDRALRRKEIEYALL